MTLSASACLAAAALLVALPRSALGQDGEDAPAPKRADIALGLSLAGTAAGAAALYAAGAADSAPIALTGVGLLVIGPGLGHLYAGEPGRALRHAAVRVGAVAVIGAGFLVAWSSPCAFGPENDDDCAHDHRNDIGVGLIAAGAAIGLASTVYSIIDAPRAAHRSSTLLIPAPITGPDGSTALGLALSARF